MNNLLQTAIQAALSAGEEILKVYTSADFGVEMKADNSPLTLADKAGHEAIVAILKETGLPILSEEGKAIPYSERKDWKQFWMVDPLDGTKEFIKRNGEFTVNIALIEDNTPILGVVYVPVTEELYYASAEGSFKSNVKCRKSNVESQMSNVGLEDAIDLRLATCDTTTFRVVGSRSHMSQETMDYIDTLDIKGKEIEIVSKGSSLKLCMVAEGLADVYPRMAPTMEWDTAAGHAIAKYAGKKVLQYTAKIKDNIEVEKDVVYNKENLLNPWFVVK